MISVSRRRSLACLPPFVVVVLVGCATTTVDTDKLEKSISASLTKQLGVSIASVTCPEDPPTEKGGKFRCVVTGTDDSSSYTEMRVTTDEGDIQTSAPFLKVREAEAFMKDRFSSQFKAKVTFTCPAIVRAKKGKRFTCRATSPGDSRKVLIRFTDDTGNVEMTLPPRRARG